MDQKRLEYTRKELEEARNEVVGWINEGKFANYKAEDCSYVNIEKGFVRIFLYTDSNGYSIRIKPKTKDYDGYLSCVAISRKPRTGEDWNRGNDLPDGPYSKETWTRIVRAILGYELVAIKRPIAAIYDKNHPANKGGRQFDTRDIK